MRFLCSTSAQAFLQTISSSTASPQAETISSPEAAFANNVDFSIADCSDGSVFTVLLDDLVPDDGTGLGGSINDTINVNSNAYRYRAVSASSAQPPASPATMQRLRQGSDRRRNQVGGHLGVGASPCRMGETHPRRPRLRNGRGLCWYLRRGERREVRVMSDIIDLDTIRRHRRARQGGRRRADQGADRTASRRVRGPRQGDVKRPKSAGERIRNKVGIPFTDLWRGGSVKGWNARDILSPGLITRGHSRRWTTGSATMPDVGSTSSGCAGRTGLPALAAEWRGSRG